MTTCEKTRDKLALWTGGDLPPEDQAAVAQHLAGCAACRAEADAWSRDLERLRQAAGAEVGPALDRERLRVAVERALTERSAALPPQSRRRGHAGPFGARHGRRWAAALVAVLALVALWRTSPRPVGPEPVDAALVQAVGPVWPRLQGLFAGCLEAPRPLDEWQADNAAGVVTILAPAAGGRGYEVVECLEAGDLGRLRTYPWAEQRLRKLRRGGAGPLLVSVCRTGPDDRAARRDLRRSVLAAFGDG